MDARALELRDGFFALLDENATSPDLWRNVWRLFVEHSWYQEELHGSAVRIARRAQAPPDLTGDIEQEAMLLLAKHLQKSVYLHVNRAWAEQHFAGWLAKIIKRDCQQAMRKLRRGHWLLAYRRGDVQTAAAKAAPLDERLDLATALRKLPKDCRQVVTLRLRGLRIVDIATRMHKSPTWVHAALHKGLSL